MVEMQDWDLYRVTEELHLRATSVSLLKVGQFAELKKQGSGYYFPESSVW